MTTGLSRLLVCASMVALTISTVSDPAGAQIRRRKTSARPSQTAPADAVGRRVEARYAALKTLSHNISGKFELMGQGGVVTVAIMNSAVRLAKPNRFLIETTVYAGGQEYHSTLVSDGSKVWEWNPDDKTYTERPASSLPRTADAWGAWTLRNGSGDTSLGLFLKPPTAKRDVSRIRGRLVSARLANGRPGYRLDMTGIPSPGGPAAASMWFDAADLLLRKTVYAAPLPKKQTGTAPANARFTFDFVDVVADEAMPDDIFKFRPPGDARLVDKMKTALEHANGPDESPDPEPAAPEKPEEKNPGPGN